MKEIKRYLDNSCLLYGMGRFDNWCVYYRNSEGECRALYDTECFDRLKQIADRQGTKKVYDDFVKIYEATTKEISDKVLQLIEEITTHYTIEKRMQIDKIFTLLYMMLLSEQNKENAILGKRIKRLGIYLYLIENTTIEEATIMLKGKKYKELDQMCKERGF